MHRKRGANLKLQDILAKLRSKNESVSVPTVIYASADIARAKSVLDRLLNTIDRNEVSYSREVAVESNEIEEQPICG